MKNNKVLELIAEGQAKEHPLLFSTPMVQAILEGRKTQTRRTKGLEFVNAEPDGYSFTGWERDPELADSDSIDIVPVQHYGLFAEFSKGEWLTKAPCEKGDILWVRETHAVEESEGEYRIVIYKASDPDYPGKWKPSIFMKRKDCRILLKVEDIRVERLHQLTIEDAIKEGIKFDDDSGYFFAGDVAMAGDAVNCFENLWCEINGRESWDSNPFVWVISFVRVGAINSKTSA